MTIPILTEEALFTWTFRRLVSLFEYLHELKVAYQQRQPERLIFDSTPNIVGSWKSRFKILNLNVSRTKRDVAPKQRYYRFQSVGDHVYGAPTFEHAWAKQGHTVT